MPAQYDQVIAFVLGFAFGTFTCWFMGKLQIACEKQWQQSHVGSKRWWDELESRRREDGKMQPDELREYEKWKHDFIDLRNDEKFSEG